ncbi:MAG: twin-arginine translocase TatA/TatE family subunit [Actinophytocola sp.]|nr:twin-arginine translocase TatA/TatE family subunit [Actinophytocola sp.]
MGSLSPWHWAILIVVLVLLFGAKKLPDAARSVGRSLKILKAETKGLREDDEESDTATNTTNATDPDMKQLPAAAVGKDADDQKVADLQRQLDELKQQADQSPKNAG